MSLKDHYTILVVPNAHGKRWEWIVTGRTFRAAAVVFGVCVALFVLLSTHRYVTIVRAIYASQLRSQNETLRRDLYSMQERIGNLGIRMRGLSQTDRVLRVWTDIPEPGEDLRQMGVGGTSDEGTEWPASVDLEVGETIMKSYASLGQLQREAGFLRSSFDDILGQITQDKALRDHTPSILPVSRDARHYISSGFGYRTDPITGRREFHNGLDVAGQRGTDIRATASGIVEKVARDRRIGFYIALNHGNGIRTIYGHLMSLPGLEPGQEVARGDIIGLMGSTGRTTGPHVHYIISVDGRAENPFRFIFDQQTAGLP